VVNCNSDAETCPTRPLESMWWSSSRFHLVCSICLDSLWQVERLKAITTLGIRCINHRNLSFYSQAYVACIDFLHHNYASQVVLVAGLESKSTSCEALSIPRLLRQRRFERIQSWKSVVMTAQWQALGCSSGDARAARHGTAPHRTAPHTTSN